MPLSCIDRMIIVSEEEYNQLRSIEQITNPLVSHFQTVTKEHKKQDGIENPYSGVHLQVETLNEMMKIKDALRQQHLLELTPKPYENRAESLFNFMKDKVKIGGKSEIHRRDGQLIEGSNIGDLIQDSARNCRRRINPCGWKEFVQYLKLHNVQI